MEAHGAVAGRRPKASSVKGLAPAGGAGPEYHCPILDPLWSDEQIQAVLARVR